MKLKQSIYLVVMSTAVMTSAPAVFAAENGFYVGGGVGYSKVKIDDSVFTIAGSTSSLSKDESDTGYKIFGGYQFHPNFGVELGYVDLGRFAVTRTFTAPVAGTANANIKASGVFVDLVGALPVQENVSLLGKIGALYSETKTSATTAGGVAFPAGTNLNPKESETNFKLGIGAQYAFTKTVAVRGEWERYFKLGKTGTTGEGDVDLFSVNLLVKF